jgi:hypothetical protein
MSQGSSDAEHMRITEKRTQMDYETILQAVGEEPEYLYKTSRGSAYGHYEDNSTIRNRSGEQHKDTSVGLQPRSGKTVYMKPEDINRMAGVFQNSEMATQFMPSSYDKESRTGKATLSLLEDYGPKKAGSVVHEASFTTVPQKGLAPVEINRSSSPIGDSGRGIHWGTTITEVVPRSAFSPRMPAGTPAQLRQGSGSLTHMLNPLKMAGGGAVKMPGSYSQGSWKLI